MLFVCHTFSVEDPDFRIQAIGQETVYDLFLILVCTAYRYTSFDKLRKTLRRRSPCYVHKCTCKVIQKFIIFLPGLVKGRILIHNTVYKFIIVFCLSADNQFHFRNANQPVHKCKHIHRYVNIIVDCNLNVVLLKC